MVNAIIFDCDGVIADSEPLHMAAFQRVLATEGLSITEEEYRNEYLSFDDRGCFIRAFNVNSRELSEEKLDELVTLKASSLEPVIRESLQIFPGVVDFIRAASAALPTAIASGALRHEIGLILVQAGISDCFRAIVAAEDVVRSKPDPEAFLKALDGINAATNSAIGPSECLVVEDSIHGVRGAQRAGMKCLAVTNSFSREQLAHADLVIDSFLNISVKDVLVKCL